VPRTVPYKEVKSKKAAAGTSNANGENSGFVEAGQTTLDGKKPTTNGSNGLHASSILDGDDEDPNTQLEMEIRGARTSIGSAGLGNNEKESLQDVEMH
jgi:DNA polymerase epsilon subunit 4